MKVILELTVDDEASVPSRGLVKALEALSRHGVRVTGVEPSEGPQALVVAQHLRLALGADAFASRLPLSPPSISALPPALLRQVEAMAFASVFDARRWLARWIDDPNHALGGKRPSDLLGTPSGDQQVSDLLSRVEWGVYS